MPLGRRRWRMIALAMRTGGAGSAAAGTGNRLSSASAASRDILVLTAGPAALLQRNLAWAAISSWLRLRGREQGCQYKIASVAAAEGDGVAAV